jgi:general secretion pathway protein G
MLVMVIIAILAAVVAQKFIGRTEQAKRTAAQQDLATYRTMLGNFEIDNGRLPTTSEGLAALMQKPSADLPHWVALTDKINNDPWGTAYVYHCPGSKGDFDLYSCGPSKSDQQGGGDNIEAP